VLHTSVLLGLAICVCEKERESEREGVKSECTGAKNICAARISDLCVCVCERERECVCERE